MMDLPARLETVISGLGYEFVLLERAGRGLLRVFIDKPEGITIDDCVAVSHQLTHWLTVEGVDYERLEVSSPGIDRPLVRPQDYVRFSGEQVSIRLRMPQDNRRKITGRLVGLSDAVVTIEVEGVPVSVELANIDSARLKPEW